jgi:hypothetical protein
MVFSSEPPFAEASPRAERRSAPRVDWPATARLLSQVSVARGETRASAGRTVNVSLTGVLVAVPFECVPGEELALRFPLDRGDDLAVVVEVVRIDNASNPAAGEWRAGCQFRHISVESRCRLARFLMRRRAAVIEAHARRNEVALPARRAA